LYIVAASLYPGGSFFNRAAVGYDWKTNYWCELLAATAKNGRPNPGRPFAFSAMIILAFSIGTCWYLLPLVMKHRYARVTIRVCGTLSMAISLFISSPYHDMVINISGGFALIALVSTFFGLYKMKAHALLSLGILCVLLAMLNNFIYHTNTFMEVLPVVQKITFACFLTWFAGLSWRVHQLTGS
jgi:hypothetical protein